MQLQFGTQTRHLKKGSGLPDHWANPGSMIASIICLYEFALYLNPTVWRDHFQSSHLHTSNSPSFLPSRASGIGKTRLVFHWNGQWRGNTIPFTCDILSSGNSGSSLPYKRKQYSGKGLLCFGAFCISIFSGCWGYSLPWGKQQQGKYLVHRIPKWHLQNVHSPGRPSSTA